MLTRSAHSRTRAGFTLLELVIGIAVVLGLVLIYVLVSGSDTEQKAALARAAQLCATSAADTGSAVIAPDDIPKRVDKELTPELDRISARRIHWRKRRQGDQVICEMQYCYTGVKDKRPFSACTNWYQTQ